MVEFIKATCPSCGGDLQLPDGLAKALCPYCGATVILEWEGRPGPGPTVASYMKLGQAALQASNFEEANEYFSKALELNPNEVQAWIGRALALLENQRPIELVGRALALHPEERPMVHTYLEKALSLDPNNVTALIYLGTLWNHDELLEKVASLDPSRRSQIARILLSMGGNVRVEDAERIPFDAPDRRSRYWSSNLLVTRFEAAYRIDPTTKKDMTKRMFYCAFDVEYKKRSLGKPYAVLVVRHQDLVDRAVEIEPALGNIIGEIRRKKFPYRIVDAWDNGGYEEWIRGEPVPELHKIVEEYLNSHS